MAIMSSEVRTAAGTPDRMIMLDDSVGREEANWIAYDAMHQARLLMPRVTSRTANRLVPISGAGWFGIYFPDQHVWFQEHGTKPFTMRSLAGKTIPMWVDDADGKHRAENPKIETRRTDDGRTQVKIFRKAARQGQRKPKVDRWGRIQSVPMSYPGAPGRISVRDPNPNIGAGNVGVRWRHPGLRALGYMNQAISEAAVSAGLDADVLYVADAGSWEAIVAGKMKGLI